MQQPSPVAEYLDALTGALSFDPLLGRRVRQEAEDHLHEALAAAGDASVDAQRRAIGAFGNAQEIASQFAALSLLTQTRRTGAVVVVGVAGIYLTMKGRLAWYGLMQWAMSAELQEYGRLSLAFNRCSFILALVLGIVSWVYIASRPVSTRLHAAYRNQLRRGLAIAIVAACPLIASIALDGVLTGLRLLTAQSLAAASVPLLSMAAELSLAVILAAEILKTMRRAGRVSSLLSR
jgi:uncharacterized membrane protein YecN with MAPEG domain